jgi:regulator of protease activity HflC (stomatin/prohibitin superfamily)
MRRTRRSGGKRSGRGKSKKTSSPARARSSSSERNARIARVKANIQSRRNAKAEAERMAVAEEAARQQAIADAEAEAQRAAAEAQRAAERLEELRRPPTFSASVLGRNPLASEFVSQIPRSTLRARAPSFVSHAPTAMNEMARGMADQEQFAIRLTSGF